ncbi:hypothetical protein M0802_010757 [Mischocyttarus mexicanus]|nr:hypothetical protein M0802_010757 [Mischocyttarus mexicanus]
MTLSASQRTTRSRSKKQQRGQEHRGLRRRNFNHYYRECKTLCEQHMTSGSQWPFTLTSTEAHSATKKKKKKKSSSERRKEKSGRGGIEKRGIEGRRRGVTGAYCATVMGLKYCFVRNGAGFKRISMLISS